MAGNVDSNPVSIRHLHIHIRCASKFDGSPLGWLVYLPFLKFLVCVVLTQIRETHCAARESVRQGQAMC
jgi:hypothetical protein